MQLWNPVAAPRLEFVLSCANLGYYNVHRGSQPPIHLCVHEQKEKEEEEEEEVHVQLQLELDQPHTKPRPVVINSLRGSLI
jgi:hypothetical protein